MAAICRLPHELCFDHGAAMRSIILAALMLTACAKEAAPPRPPELAPGVFAANPRDALCVIGIGAVQRAGFIAFGPGDANCSARGKVVQAGAGKWQLQPDGDAECRIPLVVTKDGIALGPVSQACAYYCPPGLSMAGKAFIRIENASKPITDLAGDPLC
jgi:hypothetical protein